MKARVHDLGAWAIALVLAVAAASKALDRSGGPDAATHAGWIGVELGLAACVLWRKLRDVAVVVVAGGTMGAALSRSLAAETPWTSCRCFGDTDLSVSVAPFLQAAVVAAAGLVLLTSPRRAG